MWYLARQVYLYRLILHITLCARVATVANDPKVGMHPK